MSLAGTTPTRTDRWWSPMSRATGWLCVFAFMPLGTAEAQSMRWLLHDPVANQGPSQACADELCTGLLKLIEGAERSIDLAVYGVRGQPVLTDALLAAQARGVVVRAVVDRDGAGVSYYTGTDAFRDALGTVRDDYTYEVERLRKPERVWRERAYSCERPPGFEGPLQCLSYDLGDRCLMAGQASRGQFGAGGIIMHHKFFVVDERYVWMGSANISDSGTGGYNANAAAVLDAPVVAGWYREEFEQMWVDSRYHEQKRATGRKQTTLLDGTEVEILFSPQDRPITSRVRPLLQNAERSIDVAVFFLTHKGITEDLVAAKQRGVKVRIIMDATAATNGYSKHTLLRAAGVPLKVEDWGGKMHAKSAIVDGETVIVGSMNWTGAGESGNDENTLVFKSAAHGRAYQVWFDRLWERIPDRWLNERPDPEGPDSGGSCQDGSDNDFDRLSDASDPGCGAEPPALLPLPPVFLRPKAPGNGLIKGVLGPSGTQVYVTPTMREYDGATVDTQLGERWFCSEQDARAAGFQLFEAITR